ncbi:MAG: serine/threonine protein phosphatase [Nitrospirae bacterium]|nr:serine/threonine protein phosphatase [Nitrospirota bacterium]
MTNSRLLVMGDIHGMYDELMLLLNSSGYEPKTDELVVLGDYIDRGPQSRSVIEFFMDLKARHGSRVTLLMGNHEEMCLKAHKGNRDARIAAKFHWLANGGEATLQSFGGELPAGVISFMKKLLLYAETEQYIFVHAGADHSLPLSEADPEDLLWSSSPLPHYSGKMVIVGHAIRDEVSFHARSNTLYIDTGAFQSVWGRTGRLSMVDLVYRKVHWINTGGPDHGTYSVNELIIEPLRLHR